MKKAILFSLLILVTFSQLSAQKTKKVTTASPYNTLTDIPYRDPASDSLTPYMKERCVLDLYYPTNTKDFPVIVWFHGGGLTGGEKYIPEYFMNRGLAVAAVNYRLSPQVSSPAYIDDAAAAVAWIFKHIPEYGGDPRKVIVSGHSAGGYLTSMIGLDKQWLQRYGASADSIALLAPFSGHTITHFSIREERGIPGTQPVVDKMAPLWHVRPDAPPLLLITGDRELEMLGRYEENAYMWRMMKVCGHSSTYLYEMQGSDHGGMVAPASLLLLTYIREHF
ncbi:MAG: alpha/beta hydrolase [Bacteroidota bacterium]